MTGSKAYLSFVLLSIFLLSSDVLTHELLEEERIPAHNMEIHGLEGSISGSTGYHLNDFNWTTPFVLPKVERGYYTACPNGYYPSMDQKGQVCKPPPTPSGYYPSVDQHHPTCTNGYYPSVDGLVCRLPPSQRSHYHSIAFQWPRLSVLPKTERGPMYITHSNGYYPGDYQPLTPSPLPPTKRDHNTHSVGYKPSSLKDIEPKNYEDGSVMRHRKMIKPSEIDWRSFHAFPTKTSSMTHGYKTGYGDTGEETMN